MRLHSLRTAILFGLVVLALTANGKKPVAAAQTAPPASPSVALSASPTSAQAGQPVTLRWSSTNATSITLEPSVGPVAANGSTTVKRSQSTTYTVTATGPGGSAHASAQVIITPAPPPAAVQKPSQEDISSDQREMRGLDEQIQEIKSDSLRMSAELSQLEEKLLYPSGTQVAIFVELAKGDTMRLDAVRLQIDGNSLRTTSTAPKNSKPCVRAACNGSTSATWRPGITSWTCLSTASLRAAPTSAARDSLLSAKK